MTSAVISFVTIVFLCSLVDAVHETFTCKKVALLHGSHCKEWQAKRLEKLKLPSQADCEKHCKSSYDCHDYNYDVDTTCRLFEGNCTTHRTDSDRTFYRCTRVLEIDESPCTADVGVIIDSSYSIGGLTGKGKDAKAWEIEKRFVKELAADFKTEDHDDGIRMAVGDISENAFLHIKFNEFLDYDQFDALVDDFQYQGYNTVVDKALHLAEDDMFQLNSGIRGGDVKKVLIFLTDGARSKREPDDKHNHDEMLATAKRLRDSGVHIIAIGVPDLNGDTNLKGLVEIAGTEVHAHVRDSLHRIVDRDFIEKIVNETCGGMPVYPTEAITTPEPVVTTQPFVAPPVCDGLVADIGFIIDSSYSIGGENGLGDAGLAWRLEKEFVQQFARALSLHENGVRMSLIDFSEFALHVAKFNQFYDSEDFSNHIDTIEYQGSNTRIDLALKLARSDMFATKNGARADPKIPKVLIFITDGSQSYRRLVHAQVEPTQFAELLRDEGVKIITIGVPDKYGRIDEEELFGIAGYTENMFTKDTFEEILTHDFMRSITIESCESESFHVDVDITE